MVLLVEQSCFSKRLNFIVRVDQYLPEHRISVFTQAGRRSIDAIGPIVQAPRYTCVSFDTYLRMLQEFYETAFVHMDIAQYLSAVQRRHRGNLAAL